MAHKPWSFAPYSQTFASGDILYEQITAVETIRCVCGIGDVEDETADARARILCRMKASAAMPETAEGGAYILAAAAMTADAPEHAEASVRIAGRAMLGADAGESADAAGQIAASICIGGCARARGGDGNRIVPFAHGRHVARDHHRSREHTAGENACHRRARLYGDAGRGECPASGGRVSDA